MVLGSFQRQRSNSLFFSTVVKSQATIWTQNGHSLDPPKNKPQQLAVTPKNQQRKEFRVDAKGRKSLQASKMARPAGVEPAASASGGQRSIQLSYGRLYYFLTFTFEPFLPSDRYTPEGNALSS